MEQSVINGYAEDASFLIQSFEAISSPDLLLHVSEFIPDYACRIIEIGAGLAVMLPGWHLKALMYWQ